MYTLEQYKRQFFSGIYFLTIIEGAGEVKDPVLNDRENLDGPITPLNAIDTARAARGTSEALKTAADAGDEDTRRLRASTQRGDTELRGAEGKDTLDTPSIEKDSVHPDSLGTATLEDVEAVAARNGMGDLAGEEPQEGAEAAPVEPVTPAETARRVASLNTDMTRAQAEVDQYQPGTPERQAAEQQLSAVQMLLNILQFGSVNPPVGATDSQGNPVEGRNAYSGGVGDPLSSELLAQYGGTGHELASWLQSNNFPVYEKTPNYCGRNVGEAMNAFGYKDLPSGGRNGADWENIGRSKGSQFKQIQCRPQDAPAGALISYKRNSGGTPERQASGHIEIALGENKGYYYGAVASQPGGSQKPPREGSYTIWMPTSKTPGNSSAPLTS